MSRSATILVATLVACGLGSQEASADAVKPIPVILDTDIGDDIDDTWALAFLLKCPELDLKLALGSNEVAEPRAKILAKFLETVDRTDVAVGLGIGEKSKSLSQSAWIEDYDLDSYPGTVHEDGVGALIDLVMNSEVPVTIIAVGPLQNIQQALKREPRIAEKALFVGMHGSLRMGYFKDSPPAKEYNVVVHPESCQAAFTAPWDVTITPIDTCGKVILQGDRYQRVLGSKEPAVIALMENYEIWLERAKKGDTSRMQEKSTTLFDTVAVYLAFADSFCEMESLPVKVTDEGMTVIDPDGKVIRAAMKWKEYDAFHDLLVERLIAPEGNPSGVGKSE